MIIKFQLKNLKAKKIKINYNLLKTKISNKFDLKKNYYFLNMINYLI